MLLLLSPGWLLWVSDLSAFAFVFVFVSVIVFVFGIFYQRDFSCFFCFPPAGCSGSVFPVRMCVDVVCSYLYLYLYLYLNLYLCLCV